MLNSINFNHLYYFYIIAREESLVKSAKKLNVTQPTLSQQLRQFESNIGHKLFSRYGRSLKLNNYGKYLYEHTKDIFYRAEKMLTGFNYQLSINTEVQYSIGISPSISRNYAAKILYPILINSNMGISTCEANTEELINKLFRQEIDFAIAEEPSSFQIKEGLKTYQLKEDSFNFICGNKLAKDISSIPHDLNNRPYFKYHSKNKIQQNIDSYFYENNIMPNVVGESDDLEIILTATEHDHCFSIVSEIASKKLIKEGRLTKLGKLEGVKTKVCALYVQNTDKEKTHDVLKRIKKQLE